MPRAHAPSTRSSAASAVEAAPPDTGQRQVASHVMAGARAWPVRSRARGDELAAEQTCSGDRRRRRRAGVADPRRNSVAPCRHRLRVGRSRSRRACRQTPRSVGGSIAACGHRPCVVPIGGRPRRRNGAPGSVGGTGCPRCGGRSGPRRGAWQQVGQEHRQVPDGRQARPAGKPPLRTERSAAGSPSPTTRRAGSRNGSPSVCASVVDRGDVLARVGVVGARQVVDSSRVGNSDRPPGGVSSCRQCARRAAQRRDVADRGRRRSRPRPP
jgi:hypothetical protein